MSRSDLGSLVGSIDVCDTCDVNSLDTSAFVRRSNRNPDIPMISRPDVMSMLAKIKGNHPSTVIFKAKDHLRSPVTPTVFSEIISALMENTVCQALYIQNMGNAIRDEQMTELMNLLQNKSNLWAVNIGENYEVTKKGWNEMCDLLPNTNVTHLYVSEHIIHLDLKNKMRMHIRANRKKHTLHSALQNIRVIEQVTHMWWNPINTIRHQLEDRGLGNDKTVSAPKNVKGKTTSGKKVSAATTPVQVKKKTPPLKTTATKSKVKATPAPPRLSKKEAAEAKKAEEWHARQEYLRTNPSSTVYWAKNKGGKGAENPWKFHCMCGEQCSSEEPESVHPVGAMYECTSCHIWSHTACVLGNVSQEYLEEEEEVLCSKCRAVNRRKVLRELKEMNLNWVDGEVAENDQSTECNDEEDVAVPDEGEKVDDSKTVVNVTKRSKQEDELHLDSSKKKMKCVSSDNNTNEREDDAEVSAALHNREIDMPEIARGGSPSETTHRVHSSPVSPLLSMDMLPSSTTASTAPTTSSTPSSTLPSQSLPTAPPPSLVKSTTIGDSTLVQSLDTKPPIPPSQPEAIKKESSTPNHPLQQTQTQQSPTKQLSQLQSPSSQSQSINHIGHSNFTLLTSSPLLSNGTSAPCTSNTGSSDGRHQVQANNLSLPTSPLAKPNVRDSSLKGNGSYTGTSNGHSQPNLPNSHPAVPSMTENKNSTGSSASFDPPMLLQTGNLVPLQDWMSGLTPSSLLNPMGGNNTVAAAAAAGVSVPPAASKNITSAAMNKTTGNVKTVSAPMLPNPSLSQSSTPQGSQSTSDIKSYGVKAVPTTPTTASLKSTPTATDRSKIMQTAPVAENSKKLATPPSISPIATGASKAKFSELARGGNVPTQKKSQPSAMNISNIQPVPIQPHSISHSLGLPGTSSAPQFNHNLSGSNTSYSSTGTTTTVVPKSIPNATSTPLIAQATTGAKNGGKKSSPAKNKSGVTIKLSTGSKTTPVVKSIGSPRSTCKTAKGVGSPKGNLKKASQYKKMSTSPTPSTADITSILINSTRLSYDMKKNGGMKSPQSESESLPAGQSVLFASKKQTKPSSSKLKIETDMGNPPLSLSLSRGRSMTTGDLESKGKAGKAKAPPKVKAPKMPKLDSQSLSNLASLGGSATPIKRPRRSSKGFMFVMHARVYVPAERKVGVITEEKNGGWKYVLFDQSEPPEGSSSTSTTSLSPTYESDTSNSSVSNVSTNSTALPGPPKLHTSNSENSVSALLSSMSVISPRANAKTKQGAVDTKGKWCRACDMREVGIGDVPLPNKADLLINRSHLHPHQQAHPSGAGFDLGLATFNSNESDYGFDLTDGDDLEQDELMVMGRRVAYHHPVTANQGQPPNSKRKRCESLDTGLRGMESFFDYALLMNNTLSSTTGTANIAEEPELVEDDWKLDIGNFGGVFFDEEVNEGEFNNFSCP